MSSEDEVLIRSRDSVDYFEWLLPVMIVIINREEVKLHSLRLSIVILAHYPETHIPRTFVKISITLVSLPAKPAI